MDVLLVGAPILDKILFCKDIVTRHVRVHKSKWFIQISARCYYSGKYSLQGFVTASNACICQHSNCYCQKDTKIFYKLSNNKSARLIWVYFLLHRRENLPGLILGVSARAELPSDFGTSEFPPVFSPLWKGLGWVWREGESHEGGKYGFWVELEALWNTSFSPRAGVTGKGNRNALSAFLLFPRVVIPHVKSVSLMFWFQHNRCSFYMTCHNTEHQLERV